MHQTVVGVGQEQEQAQTRGLEDEKRFEVVPVRRRFGIRQQQK